MRNSSRASFFGTNWQMAYARMLEETDQNELCGRVEIAEAAMLLRYEIIGRGSEYRRERHDLQTALATLDRLKQERLGFPVASWPAEFRSSRRARRKRAEARRA
jgi:hypothetical protein